MEEQTWQAKRLYNSSGFSWIADRINPEIQMMYKYF